MEWIALYHISLPGECFGGKRIYTLSFLKICAADTHNAMSGIFPIFTQFLERFSGMVFPVD